MFCGISNCTDADRKPKQWAIRHTNRFTCECRILLWDDVTRLSRLYYTAAKASPWHSRKYSTNFRGFSRLLTSKWFLQAIQTLINSVENMSSLVGKERPSVLGTAFINVAFINMAQKSVFLLLHASKSRKKTARTGNKRNLKKWT